MKMKLSLLLLSLLPCLVSAELINGQATNRDTPPMRVTTDGQPVMALQECEDDTLNTCAVTLTGSSTRVTTATSTELKEGRGELVGFYIASTTGGTVAFYNDNDGTCSSSQVTGTITPAIGWHFAPLPFSTAICALTANTIDVTFVWR